MGLQGCTPILFNTAALCAVVEVKLETKRKYMERAQGNDWDSLTKQGSRWPGKQSNNPKVPVRKFPSIFFTLPNHLQRIFEPSSI